MRAMERAEAALDRLEATLHALERRHSPWGAACVLATGLMLLGALYARPAVEPVSHGVYYAELSRAPFAPGDNPVAYRILTPLLAWLLGLRGHGILALNLIIAWATLAIVYRYYRSAGRRPALALAYAAILGTSMPTLFTIHVNGYTDAATYLLLFMLVAYASSPALCGLLLFLSLLNRESILFMLPFLLLLQHKRGALWGTVLAVVLAVGAYAVVRYLLGLRAAGGQSPGFYVSPLLRDPFHWLRKASVAYYQGVFSAFKLLWVLPVVGMWLCMRRGRWLDAALVASAALGALAQTILAVDTTRMLCLAFPAVLLGLESVEADLTRLRLEPAVWTLIVANLFVPQLYVAGNALYVVQTLLGYLLTH